MMPTAVRPLHWLVLLACTAINILDGFDLMSIAFTATHIMADWKVEPRVMGLVFGSGLAGVGLGSLLLASLADRFGRRPSILLGLMLVTVGMVAVLIARGPVGLMQLRFITGLGIGLLLPSINTLVSEYAPPRWRALAISLYAVGYPLGAMCSSALAPYLIARSSWRAVYLCGGLASLALIPIVAAFLPESLEFLLTLQPAGALRKIERITHRLGLQPPARLPERAPGTARPSPWVTFKIGYARQTLLISTAFFLLFLTSFFVSNWLPAIITREGFAGAAAPAGILLTSGGLVGGIAFGLLAARFNIARLSALYLAGSFVLVVVFALYSLTTVTVLLLSGLLGLLLYGAAIGLYTLAARIFPLQVRAAGTGFALAVGRLGAVLGLSIGGWLIGMELPRAQYMSLLALPALAAVPMTYALCAAASAQLAPAPEPL
jgi:benzoate transport